MPLVPSLIVNVPTGGGGGCIHDGRIHNGRIHNGRIHNGRIHNGRIHNGRIHNGRIHNGRIHNGRIHNGRIHNGALVNMSVNFGPVSSNGFLPGYIGSSTGLDYNPRCLVRDIGPATSRSGLAYQNMIDLLARSADCTAFVNNLDTGMHAAGHNSVEGMLFDLFVLPGDSVFYYHHAQVE